MYNQQLQTYVGDPRALRTIERYAIANSFSHAGHATAKNTAIMEQLLVLQQELKAMRINNAEHKEDLARLSTASPHQSQTHDSKFHLQHPHTKGQQGDETMDSQTTFKSQLKASDVPKFYGNDNEDIDQWIVKVTAIFEYFKCSDIDLLQRLPTILQDKASTWFAQLGTNKRSALITWSARQSALRNAFYLLNHNSTLGRQSSIQHWRSMNLSVTTSRTNRRTMSTHLKQEIVNSYTICLKVYQRLSDLLSKLARMLSLH
jgi:hypothetical protein